MKEKHPEGEGRQEHPVWLKIGKDIPFVEFVIADIIRKNGFVYNEKWQGEIPSDELEKVRKAVVNANVPGLKVVKEKLHYKEIKDLKQYIEDAGKQLKKAKESN